MPNWCSNNLIVRGSTEEIARFKEKASDNEEVLSLNTLCPKPESISSAPYDPVGYQWEQMNWGTKWGVCESAISAHSSTSVHYSFDSAWSPPLMGFITASKDFPTLEFTVYYEEQGCDFMGRAVISNGSIDDRCRGYVEPDDRPEDEEKLYRMKDRVDYVEGLKTLEFALSTVKLIK